ncbi:hypothetical protein P19_0171 [Aeromonas phage P19]|nr:hypothetical protein assk_131 [Aeromonas phage Assk]QMV28902.1 hypothetical protein AP1_0195 [Aeromonas phage AP1]UKM62659.1 hypothetical protein P19_0171 [Aeromonas phage P19]
MQIVIDLKNAKLTNPDDLENIMTYEQFALYTWIYYPWFNKKTNQVILTKEEYSLIHEWI